jgi:hypothetical protein
MSATVLGGPVTLVPPAGYEISVDSGKTWYASGVPALPADANHALSVSVMVRLNAPAAGSYDGNIMIQTDSSAGVSVPVTGIAYSKYSISPNPAHSYVNIYHAKLFTVAKIRVYNLNGHLLKMVYSKPATNVTTINISALPNGMYFVVVERLNEKVLLKFIKQ